MTVFAHWYPLRSLSWRNVFALSSAATLHVAFVLFLLAPVTPQPVAAAAPEPDLNVVFIAAPPPPPPAPPPPPEPPTIPRAQPTANVAPEPAPAPEIVTAVASTPSMVEPPSENPAEIVRAPADSAAGIGAGYGPRTHVRYPSIALRKKLQGVVLLRVRVGVDGSALDVTVERSSSHPVLDQAAVRSVREWRFIPEIRAGAAVEGYVLVPIQFRLGGG